MVCMSKMDLRLAKTTIEDLSQIVNMEVDKDTKIFIKPYSYERHKQVIEDPDEEHLKIINQNETILGFIILAGLENPDKILEFRRIVVLHKGKGTGRKAIKELKKYCFEKLNCKKLWLDVYHFNLRAKNLYLSEDFQIEKEVKDDGLLVEEFESLLIMSLERKNYNNYFLVKFYRSLKKIFLIKTYTTRPFWLA
jgi:diamine N-acetyltransferase